MLLEKPQPTLDIIEVTVMLPRQSLPEICFQELARNLPSMAPGKIVHEEVSHVKQCLKTAQR